MDKEIQNKKTKPYKAPYRRSRMMDEVMTTDDQLLCSVYGIDITSTYWVNERGFEDLIPIIKTLDGFTRANTLDLVKKISRLDTALAKNNQREGDDDCDVYYVIVDEDREGWAYIWQVEDSRLMALFFPNARLASVRELKKLKAIHERQLVDLIERCQHYWDEAGEDGIEILYPRTED